MMRWFPPDDGWWKLNCNGTPKGNPGLSGAGSVIRNNKRDMIFAFYEFLQDQTNTFAKLYAIFRGLELSLHAGGRCIRLELDATAVLNILHKDNRQWRLQLLTCLWLLRRQMNVVFLHIYREGNKPTWQTLRVLWELLKLSETKSAFGGSYSS
ncbi:UNVERIFIED_CONTAM: hypothetical protein Sradi_0217900 [Sesamum radiatum]|uniref:RNase H type-1 domain-containing protein n=1 Tax=Sesamum radiatum TaxID=300843 RepID=A0AAW2VZQ3_SESRA